jgi:acetyltransferase
MDNRIMGEVRTVTDPDNSQAEFAILVRPEFQGKGLGFALLGKMIRYCRDRGTAAIFGDVLAANARMLKLARAVEFDARRSGNDGIVRISLDLAGAARPAKATAGALQ